MTLRPAPWAAALLALIGVVALLFMLARGLPAALPTLRGDLDVVLTTLGLVLAGLILSLLLGGGLALLGWSARLPRLADALATGAYLIPPFIGATAWLAALGPGNVLTGRPLLPMYSVWGILLAWVTHYAPLAYLLATQGGLPTLAARVHGLSGWRTLTRIVLPIARPGLTAAALIALSLLGNFGVPAVLGFPAKLYTLSTLAYARLLNPTLEDPLAATSGVAWLLVLLALPALLSRSGNVGEVAPETAPPASSLTRRLAWAALTLWALVSLALPLAAIVVLAFKPAYAAGFTLDNFAGALALDSVRRGLFNSLLLAGARRAARCWGCGSRDQRAIRARWACCCACWRCLTCCPARCWPWG